MKGTPCRLDRFVMRLCVLLTAFLHPGNSPDADTGGLLRELTPRFTDVSIAGPRLSVLPDPQSCPGAVLTPGIIPSPCEPKLLTARSARRLRRHVEAATDAPHDPDALHANALINVLSGQTETSFARAIDDLVAASRAADANAVVLADLSAIHLVRAQQTQLARDLWIAIDAAARAVDEDPRNQSARYNLALALQWFGLEEEAKIAWQQYIDLDSTSGWAREAEAHLHKLSVMESQPPLPLIDAEVNADELAAYATAAPQEARVLGWNRLLGDWATFALDGDSVQAELRLRQAAVLGDVLESRGGDATLADAVRSIRTHADNSTAKAKLAQAHKAYAISQQHYAKAEYEAVERLCTNVAQSKAPSPPLRNWAATCHASMLIVRGNHAEAELLYRNVLSRIDLHRHSALAGRVFWLLGTLELRRGRYEPAALAYERSAVLFAQNGERENLGAVQMLMAETSSLLAGARTPEQVQRALNTLRPYRGSVWKNNLLNLATRIALNDGLTHAAFLLQNEGIRTASRAGISGLHAEARLFRARMLLDAARPEEAASDLAKAEGLLNELGELEIRRWLTHQKRLVDARMLLHTEPYRASILLDSLVTVSFGTRDQLTYALALRSEARLAMGRLDGATGDLDSIVALTRFQDRKALLNTVERQYRQIVMRYSLAGRMDEALALIERARHQLTYRNHTRLTPFEPTVSGPAGQVLIEYLFVGDTLQSWIIAGSSIRFVSLRISRQDLSRTIRDAQRALELRTSPEVYLPLLQDLYERLIQPLRAHLGAPGTPLVIIADGELVDVPFAALHDARQQQYLVERHPIRFARSLSDASREPEPWDVSGSAVVLIADPAFNPTIYPLLGRLPEARVEADSIKAEYPNINIVSGSGATEPVIRASLGRTSMLHFGGHAVYDADHPNQSYLVLSPLHGQRGSGELTASEIERMDLTHVRLAVLAACETFRSKGGWAHASTGLTDAVLTGGAGGAVGSLWRVRDDLTRSLMIGFHRAYSDSGDGTDALRRAQLGLLRSNDPDLRSPSAWAGFQYIGN